MCFLFRLAVALKSKPIVLNPDTISRSERISRVVPSLLRYKITWRRYGGQYLSYLHVSHLRDRCSEKEGEELYRDMYIYLFDLDDQSRA